MANCTVYKNGLNLGTGAITNGATSVTSWTPVAAAALHPHGAAFVGRNVEIMMTSSTDAGKVMRARITADNGSGTLTVAVVGIGGGNPYAT
jgi:hypothetical protein